jgi:hypothetical protein
MFASLFGRRGDSVTAGPFYRPYRAQNLNHVYNLLFCDNFALWGDDRKGMPLDGVLAPDADREALERIANDIDMESRVRALAYARLRAMKCSVPTKRLLATIVEVAMPEGLDVVATFADGGIRYLNHAGKLAVFEPPTPPELVAGLDEVRRLSQILVNRFGPWDKPRRSPPTGDLTRMSFLVSDGLYFGEGKPADMANDRFAAPLLLATARLLQVLVKVALTQGKPIG